MQGIINTNKKEENRVNSNGFDFPLDIELVYLNIFYLQRDRNLIIIATMNIIELQVGENNAKCVGYLHEVPSEPVLGHTIRPCVVICPGGAYRFTSPREAEPVALAYLNAGFQAFILYYSCGKDILRESPLIELATVVDNIKKNSEQYYVNKDQIVVTGFSAGGHLAASLATMYNSEELKGFDCKCAASVLCYPVLSTVKGVTHEESAVNISKGEETLRKYLSLEYRVDSNTIPTFIWHTRFDPAVSVENTIRFITALSRYNVDFEAHIFEEGEHGISLCNTEVNTKVDNTKIWFELALVWLCKQLNYSI